MFDIGVTELFLIGVVALVVVGPERLPKLATTLGRWVGRARHFVSNVKNDIDREMRQEQIREALGRDADLNEIKDIIHDGKYTIENEINSAKQDYVVAARDEDPGRDGAEASQDESSQAGSSQAQQIQEQEDGMEGYGLTDHTDNSDELDREFEASQAKAEEISADNGRPNNKSNG